MQHVFIIWRAALLASLALWVLSTTAEAQVDPQAARAALLASEDFDQKLRRIYELEGEVFGLLDNQPLRLGALGSALLDIDPASLAGHLALAQYYEHLDEEADAAAHRSAADDIVAAIDAGGDGSRERPWPVLTATEAALVARVKQQQPLGSIYSNDASHKLMLVMTVATPGDGHHEQRFFDLSATFDALRQLQPKENWERFTPGSLLGFLADQGDSAAQAAIGGTLLSGHPRAFEQAMAYLGVASEQGNLIATLLLAEGHVRAATRAAPADAQQHLNEAAELYLDAIGRGSPDAMYELGSLYLQGTFGADNVVSGEALLHQAADAGHVGAMLRLASAYLTGEPLEKDVEQGVTLMQRAAASGNRRARIALGRLAASEQDIDVDDHLIDWLRELGDDDYEALVVLGNLYGGGHHVRRSARKARRLYRRAAELTTDPQIVNEIAWTFAVSKQRRLRDPRTAVRLMDEIMVDGSDASEVPAYLDTWAAAYAAIGDFERAVEIQQRAIAKAEERGEHEVMDELRAHLEMFKAGKTVREDVP